MRHEKMRSCRGLRHKAQKIQKVRIMTHESTKNADGEANKEEEQNDNDVDEIR